MGKDAAKREIGERIDHSKHEKSEQLLPKQML